jgi:hypothetical protein
VGGYPIVLRGYCQSRCLEGSIINFTREAVQVDSTKKLEESDAMLREFGKVLVDHIQRRLEDGVQDGRNLRGKERLII